MPVTGLAPSSVRIELEAPQVAVLVDELLHRIHSRTGSMLEERARGKSTELTTESNWLLEWRNLLSAAGEAMEEQRPLRAVMPAEVACELVPACCVVALERLEAAVTARKGELRELAGGVWVWTDTLAELRALEADAPEAIAL